MDDLSQLQKPAETSTNQEKASSVQVKEKEGLATKKTGLLRRSFDSKVGMFSVLIGLIALITTVILPFYSERQSAKALSVTPISRVAIIAPDTGAGLKFTVNGIQTNNIYSGTIDILNYGGQTIDDTDFYKNIPINIVLPNKCLVVSTSYDSASSPELNKRIQLSHSRHEVYISPTLLNSGDGFRVNVITANCIPTYKPTGTIKGISQINTNYSPLNEQSIGVKLLRIAIALCLAIACVMLIYTFVYDKNFFSRNAYKFAVYLIALLTFVSTFYYFGFYSGQILKDTPTSYSQSLKEQP